ncbi:MAG: SDR family oxidoreductase, partial [Bryobacteraceae bacterium]
HALGRLGKPEHIASAIAWLLTPENDWVTGQVLGVDGGLGSVRPGASSSLPNCASLSSFRPIRIGSAPSFFSLRARAEPIPPPAPTMMNRVFSKLK